ncbi:MAG: type II toxin-antitoxin system death-on-curing family toxin [Acidimicrobiia bacterium]|nr:type II toxin-antitoxin system death-on-curing family toxin [Acidimicrobiia bacterium]
MASRYLTVVEVLAIHQALVDEFGVVSGVRDMGALESAVFRPQTGYYDDPIAEAAALMESLIKNHPFFDGNKRVGLAAADIHLRMNGWYIVGDPRSIADNIIELIEERRLDQMTLDDLLRETTEER